MCDNPKVALLLKSEFDVSFMLTGKRQKPIFVGRLSDYAKNIVNSSSYFSYDISSHFPPEYDIIFIPCRKCFSCRLDHSRRRAGQAFCEYKTSKEACFLTLTFGDDSTYSYFRNRKYNKLSPYMSKRMRDYLTWSLDSKTFKDFMKRLRDHIRQVDMRRFCLKHDFLHKCIFKCDKFGCIDYNVPRLRVKYFEFKDFILENCIFRKIRFLHSAEYGSRRGRPHHHCIIYGVDFTKYSDVYTQDVFHSGKKQSNLKCCTLDKLWSFGDVTVGSCTPESINYVTRYCLKKVLGENKDLYYSGRKPEHITCSTRPALGHDYLISNFSDICKNRHVVIPTSKGKIIEVPICRYFNDFIKKVSTEQNFGVSYGSYSDIVYCRSVSDNVVKYNKILNTGFFNWSKSKSVQSNNIVKKLKRSFDDSNIFDLSFLRKLKAFNISYEYYCKNKFAVDSVMQFLNLSYRNFEPTISYRKLNYINFEKERYRLIEHYRKLYIDTESCFNISKFEYFQKVKEIKAFENPFKSTGRTPLKFGSAFVQNYIDKMVKIVC